MASRSKCVTGSRSRTGAVALVAGLFGGALAGCPLELDRSVSCGDGWWDKDYEQCDPRDPVASHRGACRDQGLVIDAVCDPVACEILASDQDCTSCGDGIASGDEQCDGDDLRGESCSAGSGTLRCDESCNLDHSACPEQCNDGHLSGGEECEPSLMCGEDADCPEGKICYGPFGECISAVDTFMPSLACSGYETKAVGVGKPYTSGTIDRCTDECFFGRNLCSFCGDDELDGEYSDFVFPSADPVTFPAEICDGELAQPELLRGYCEPLCVSNPINSDVVVLCDFECNESCSGFAGPSDVVPGQDPEAIGCCLAKASPCPNFDTEGVPDFPCCSWLEKPTWLAEKKCVAADTGQLPITYVCP